MNQMVLNLARKWRSKQFKEIVGQDLVVKILQNSLYKNSFFPVYLFSGQRGCGKTTTARVFAAALNCKALPDFQKKPKEVAVPCNQCESCVATLQGRHPDFIEIDAASYTGVDNIRNIIDTSSFLPVIADRKVYLIDEVHMLSKAAFNALLKILEEPPKFVVFILATTELHKIPETVKSRCFQLFFNPVMQDVVVEHLQYMCDEEEIAYELSALQLIAYASEGSLRDAINMLEQVRFAADSVSRKGLESLLGYADDADLYRLLQAVFEKNDEQLSQSIAQFKQQGLAFDYIIQILQELLYDTLMMHYELPLTYAVSMPDSYKACVKEFGVEIPIQVFGRLLDMQTYSAKSTKQDVLLHMQLLTLISDYNPAKKKIENTKIENSKVDAGAQVMSSDLWQQFLERVRPVLDPILYAILCSSIYEGFDRSNRTISIKILKKFMMFHDLFLEHKKIYQPLLETIFCPQVMLHIGNYEQNRSAEKVSAQQPLIHTTHQQKKNHVHQATNNNKLFDKETWKITHTLLTHFGGSISEITEEIHEQDA